MKTSLKFSLFSLLLCALGCDGTPSPTPLAQGECNDLAQDWCANDALCHPDAGLPSCQSSAYFAFDCRAAVSVSSNFTSCYDTISTFPCSPGLRGSGNAIMIPTGCTNVIEVSGQ
jgi:hypothetical protein